MSKALDVLARAARRIGYRAPADPQPGSEAGRYWTAGGKGAWLSGPSTTIWWCMLFVSMCLDECGQIDAIGGFSFNTDTTLNRVRAGKGGRLVPVTDATAGDVVIFNWNGGPTDHVGFVERNLGGGRLQTIEGNTSPGAAGSQSAGNGVWRRVRSHSIAAVIRPAYTDARVSAAPPAPATSKIRGVQAAVRAATDGIVGPDTRKRVEAVRRASRWGGSSFPYGTAYTQQVVGTTPDGIWGPASAAAHDRTTAAIQRAVGATPDGIWGPVTDAAVRAIGA